MCKPTALLRTSKTVIGRSEATRRRRARRRLQAKLLNASLAVEKSSARHSNKDALRRAAVENMEKLKDVVAKFSSGRNVLVGTHSGKVLRPALAAESGTPQEGAPAHDAQDTTEDNRTPEQVEREKRYTVAALVVGVRASGERCRYMKAVPYASMQRSENYEEFWRVEWDGEIFGGMREDQFELQTYALPGSGAAENGREEPICIVPAARSNAKGGIQQNNIAKHVLKFLRRHRGVVVLITGVGARSKVNCPS